MTDTRETRYAEAIGMPAEDAPRSGLLAAVMAVADEELAESRAEVERWIEKANEAGAAYATANTKHHEELDRANRLEAMLDRLAGISDDNLTRAQASEAREAALRARIEALADSPSQPGRWVFPEGDEDAPGVWVTDLRAALTSPAEDTTPEPTPAAPVGITPGGMPICPECGRWGSGGGLCLNEFHAGTTPTEQQAQDGA